MKTRTMLSLGLGALVLTGTMVGPATPGMIALAGSAENSQQAAKSAAKASKYLAKRNAEKAVRYAEEAVGYAPHDAGYRALLGQSYLLAGRFVSARQAFTDSLTLDSTNSSVALNLALTQIAAGDWAGARGTLEAHPGIEDSDRGLAFALAGDPVKAVEILDPAARAADASAKTRQNLALSLALAGRWAEAKSVAAIDLPADQVDARIMQWAAFARPTNAYDQVASLLGVQPIADAGLPTQLALVMPQSYGLASAEPVAVPEPVAEPLDAYMPGSDAMTLTASAEPQPLLPTEDTEIAGTGRRVVFGPREEIVQAIPASTRRTSAPTGLASAATAAPTRTADVSSPAKGRYYVQIGAYDSSAVARDSWRKVVARVPALGTHAPQESRISTAAGSFTRVAVGGFARNDADAMCRQVKAKGGDCFVRTGAGDQVAAWYRGDRQLASR